MAGTRGTTRKRRPGARALGRPLERIQQAAIAIALQGVVECPCRVAAPRLERREQGCQGPRAGTVPLRPRDGLPQPCQQDIQVADAAEHTGQPFQLPLDLLAPWPIDQVLERAELAAQPPDRGSQAMDALAVPPPGLGVAGRDPRDRSLKSRQDRFPRRVVRPETGRRLHQGWTRIPQGSRPVLIGKRIERFVMQHDTRREILESAATLSAGERLRSRRLDGWPAGSRTLSTNSQLSNFGEGMHWLKPEFSSNP